MLESKENAIEFLYNDKTATCTFCNQRFINRVKKLSKEYKECEIVVENKDGSIIVHIPTKWIKISPPRKLSEEQREQAAERLKKIMEEKNG